MFKNKKAEKGITFFCDKKAGERILSIYLFIIYMIVGIGIVSGVLIFYGFPLDVRESEAEILSDKVIDCFVSKGNLREEIKEVDLQEHCNFNFKDNTQKYQGEERYGVKVELYDFDTNTYEKTLGIAGRSDFFQYCDLEGKDIPKCNKKDVYVLFKEQKFLLKITSAVGKVEKD